MARFILDNKVGGYRCRSQVPEHEILKIVRMYEPIITEFFDNEEEMAKFQKWREEYEEKERLEKEEKRKQDPYGRVQKSGHAVRFLNAVKAADIETVGQLLALGRRGAEDIRNSGRKCVDLAAKALENLYGIKDW